MSTATLIQLKNAGESITMGVESCKLMEIGKFPEVELIGLDGSNRIAVWMPQKSADRQLERAGLTYASAAGKILTISRDENRTDPSKPYWGLRVAGSMPPRNGAMQPHPAGVKADLPEDFAKDIYRQDTHAAERMMAGEFR